MKKIAEYIRNQLHEDKILDDLSLKEYIDPFTGDLEKRMSANRMLLADAPSGTCLCPLPILVEQTAG